MRAVICQNAELRVDDVPDPNPGPGQVKLSVARCGICGSDLHARHGIDQWADLGKLAGYDRLAHSTDPLVFGHEFSGEVAEYGTKTRKKIPTGSPVVALPLLRNQSHVDSIGLSAGAPGAYAEHLNVEESLMFAVPNGLPADVAALTEPMAVAHHAVRRGEVKKKQVAIVIGCGPVGLGVILMLKASGVRTVVASDFSAGRRALAKQCGADIVVDPKVDSPYTAAPQTKDHLNDIPQTLELAVSTVEKLGKLPIDWSHVWRAADKVGAATPKHPVVFECVGVPGMIEGIVEQTPLFSRVVVVGVCVGPDKFQPALAINKEVDLRFVIGYTPLEFRDTLHMLAEGKVDPRPLITGEVGLQGVDAAFTTLGDPETHAKILVDPKSSVTAPHV